MDIAGQIPKVVVRILGTANSSSPLVVSSFVVWPESATVREVLFLGIWWTLMRRGGVYSVYHMADF